MKANEVRIGNWVYDLKFQSNLQFRSFFGLCNFEQSPDDFQPIPLTPEILKKAGFVKEGLRYSKDWVYLWQDGNNIVFALAEMQEAIGTFLPVKFVHQLQNLYFAFTGEELEINL